MQEEEIIDIDPIYKKGFEHGYWLKRGNSPELEGFIERSTTPNYKAGLVAGQQEAERETFLANLQKQKSATQEHKPKGPKPR